MENFSLRVPEQWAGLVNSAHVQRWLADFFQAPRPLPSDPGPGRFQISLSLPARAVRVLSAGLGEPTAVALRRLSALHLGSLPPGGRELILPVVAVPESLSWSAPSPEYAESTEGPGYSHLDWNDNSQLAVETSHPNSGLAARGWWSELPFEMRVTLIVSAVFLLLIIFLSKAHKRAPIPARLPRPEFESWTPVGF